MFFYKNPAGRKKLALKITLGVITSVIVFSQISINSVADSPSASSTQEIYHVHRGSSQSGGRCFQNPVYKAHQHTGSSNGGGCYTVKHTQTHTGYDEGCTCNGCGVDAGRRPWETGGNDGICADCGHTLHSYSVCHYGAQYYEYTTTSYSLGCGKSAGVRYESEGVEFYDQTCPLEEKSYGSITLTNITPEWTSGTVTLSGEKNDPTGILSENGYGQLTFEAMSGNICSEDTASIEVSENGIYAMNIALNSDLFDSSMSQVMLSVSNIDRTAPSNIQVSYDNSSSWVTTNTITVSAVDLQPDGTDGSGLASKPYSFDGGCTWQSASDYTVSENCTIPILIRDNCGNIAQTELTLTNIDSAGPDVSYLTTDIWYEDEGPRKYHINANDAASGLDELPYSYDGGQTWTADTEVYRASPGEFTVLVKDACGNITSITISNDADIRPPSPNTDSSASEQDPTTDQAPEQTPEQTFTPNTPKSPSSEEVPDNTADKETLLNTDMNDIFYNKDLSDEANDNSTDIYSFPSDEDISDSSVPAITTYNEELPISKSSGGVGNLSQTEKRHIYQTTAFKVATGTGGGLLGLGVLFFVLMLLTSGALLYSYDVNKYRLMWLVPIHHSEKGYCVKIKEELLNQSYSSSYKLTLGPIFIKKHSSELINIQTPTVRISMPIEKNIYFECKDEVSLSN